MRVLRYALIVTALSGLGWFLFSVKVAHRTPVGHLQVWWKRTRPVESMFAWAKQKLAGKPPKRSLPRHREPIRDVEAVATQRRVSALESAARAAQPVDPVQDRAAPRSAVYEPERVPPSHLTTARRLLAAPARMPIKTRVDEHHAAGHKKALDDLVSSRISRP